MERSSAQGPMAQQLGWHFGTCSTGHNLIPRVDDLTKLDKLDNPRVTISFHASMT